MTIQPELVAATAVVRLADHPSLRSRIHRLARAGELVRVLPGTYVPASTAGDRRMRLAAACAWAPHACLWGNSALDAASGCLDPFGRGEEIQLAGEALPAVADWSERRAGNGARRTVLAEVRQRPWSGLERELHRLLRQARIGGWRANVEVTTALGTCVVDVVFDAEPLVLEVDSWEYHASQEAFELDRRRQNGLALSGYRILRLTAP